MYLYNFLALFSFVIYDQFIWPALLQCINIVPKCSKQHGLHIQATVSDISLLKDPKNKDDFHENTIQ